tara:strand:+ start:2420 stop:2701 length:282 start_codon:yes stop_codon:yes gene_type:complete
MYDIYKNMCDNSECVCVYCKNDNYDRYIGDHFRQCLDSINMNLNEPLTRPKSLQDEEQFYEEIAREAMGEMYGLKHRYGWCEWLMGIFHKKQE